MSVCVCACLSPRVGCATPLRKGDVWCCQIWKQISWPLTWVPIIGWEGRCFTTCGPTDRPDVHLGPVFAAVPQQSFSRYRFTRQLFPWLLEIILVVNNCEGCNEGQRDLEVSVWKLARCGCPMWGVVYYFMNLLNSDMSYLWLMCLESIHLLRNVLCLV